MSGDSLGQRHRKVDAATKMTGIEKYADDIALPRMLHCKILRSPHAHARIRRLDASNGNSRSRGNLALSSSGSRPPLMAATSNASSSGSPRPARCRCGCGGIPLLQSTAQRSSHSTETLSSSGTLRAARSEPLSDPPRPVTS